MQSPARRRPGAGCHRADSALAQNRRRVADLGRDHRHAGREEIEKPVGRGEPHIGHRRIEQHQPDIAFPEPAQICRVILLAEEKTAMRGAVAPQDRADAAFDAGVGKPADELGPPVDAIAVSSAGRSLMVEPIRGIRQIDLVLVVDNFSIYRDHFALDQGAIEDIWPILTPRPYALPAQFKTNLARQIMPFQCG